MAERVGVLFVCLGNICRSPMAHGMLLKRVRDAGLQDRFTVDSCGTGNWHVGDDMSDGTAKVLRARGAHYPHDARQLREADFDRFDHVLAMDRSNLRTIAGRYPHLADRAALFTSLVGGGDVPDPYGGRPADYAHVWDVLEPAMDAWWDRWTASLR